MCIIVYHALKIVKHLNVYQCMKKCFINMVYNKICQRI